MKKEKPELEFEFAPQIEIESYKDIAHDLLFRVYGIKQSFITDESSLDDFNFELTEDGIQRDRREDFKKIEEIYGVDVSDVEGLNLAKVCQRISILGKRP